MQDTTQITRRTVPILGTEITITDNPDLTDDGVFYTYKREIEMKPEAEMLDRTAREYERNMRYREVLRHELIHAFFSLAGLDAYSNDETLVDWLAVMYPRLTAAFKKAGCDF